MRSSTKNTTRIRLHCYNHFGFDYGKQVAEIVDAAHKHDVVEIDTMTEPFDIREIEWKGTKFLEILRSICHINNWPLTKFHIRSYNLLQPTNTWPKLSREFEQRHFVSVSRSNSETKKKINKHFGIYINNSSWPRLWLSSHLFNNHKLKTDQTFVRSLSNPAHAANLDLDPLIFNFSQQGYTTETKLAEICKFLESLPVPGSDMDLCDITDPHFSLKNDTESSLSYIGKDLMDRYQSIFCDIVCETMFTGDIFSIDEKIARPMVTLTPFIVMGPRGHLLNLKKIGFKTFSNFWDESYDYATGAHRCIEIAKLIDHLSTYEHDKLEALYNDIKPILEFNRSHYLELCQKSDLCDFFKEKLDVI